MTLNDEQIKQIANSIVFDVRQYIKEHQTEFENFLAESLNEEAMEERTDIDE